MTDTGGKRPAAEEGGGSAAHLYKKDFWSDENLKFSEPHYRLQKVAGLVNRFAQGRECDLLDVGCGPATLMRLLAPNIRYHGVDIAIQNPAPFLLEADLSQSPIRFGDKYFDIVVAQGVFEYLGDFLPGKFAEVRAILGENGLFLTSYWNYGHRRPQAYWAHNSVKSIQDFRNGLARHFNVDRSFPASHNWQQGWPNRKFIRAVNMHVNLNIPLISPALAVEYLFLCSPRRSPRSSKQ